MYECAHVQSTHCMHAASNGFSPQSTKVFFKTNKTGREIRKPTKDWKHKSIEEVCSLLRNSSFFSGKEPHKNSINIVDMFCGELNAISFPFCFLFYLCAPCMWLSLWAFCRMCFCLWFASKGKRYWRWRYIFLSSVTVTVSPCVDK